MNYEETMYYIHALKEKEAFFQKMIPADQYGKYRNMFMRFDIERADIITTPMSIKEINDAGMGKYITPMLISFKTENGTIIEK